jgi:hypothetical protein
MMNLPNYARALRCIGQALQEHQIEAFEIRIHAKDFRVLVGDPNPPYTGMIELQFGDQQLEIIDRQGLARRGHAAGEVRFDSVSEMLRALGEYIDHKRARLQRIDNISSPNPEDPSFTIEYQNRAGDMETEHLTMSFMRDASVRMYKRRTRLASPISMLTRKP